MATLNVQYTIETHVGSIPKTTINGFPCPWLRKLNNYTQLSR